MAALPDRGGLREEKEEKEEEEELTPVKSIFPMV